MLNEFNNTQNNVRRQQISLSSPVQGASQAFLKFEAFYVWPLALKVEKLIK